MSFRLPIVATLGGLLLATMPVIGSPAQAAEFERLVVASGVRSMTLPCLARLQDGRLLVVWSNGGQGILAAFSADHGRSWSAPRCLLNTATGHDYDPSLVVSGPRIILSATVTAGSGIGRSTTQCVRSDDNGQSWTSVYEIPMHHRYSCGKTHRGLRLRSGTLLMGYSWDLLCEQGKTLQAEGQMHLRAGAMISTDNGLTWHNGGDTDAACTPLGSNAVRGTDEPALVERDDGSVYMLMRTGSDHLYQAHSTDEGKTWTGVGPSPLRGSNAPAALSNFAADGRRGILCVWDNALVRFPLSAALSFDGGRTWSKPKDIAGPTDGRQASYPSCVEAADGTLMAVWQQETSAGWDVRAARFRPEWVLKE
jgi:predicted neuraminidase